MTDYAVFEVTEPAQLKEYEFWLGEQRVQEIVSKADELVNQGFRVAVLLREVNVLGMDCDGPFIDTQYQLEGIRSMTPEDIEAMIEHGFDDGRAYGWKAKGVVETP